MAMSKNSFRKCPSGGISRITALGRGSVGRGEKKENLNVLHFRKTCLKKDKNVKYHCFTFSKFLLLYLLTHSLVTFSFN